MRKILALTAAYAAAVLATALLGSVVQTQFNLAALQALDAPMPPEVRLRATGADLVGFGPNFAAIVAAGFLAAFVVSGLLARLRPGARTTLHALAGATAVAVAIQSMIWLFEITPIAAARGVFGFAALAACGALGGWVFARLAPRPAGA
ncbi:hypothetical protein PC39_05955 [Salinisphaera sp. PC39]|uniref:hypothetical protein n=1 Tax=Salinisphaera sp. PC39 TaxID=1304156 RepID=UPI0033429425